MKTLTTLTLATLFVASVATPASANTLTESLTEAVSNQLTELSSNIRQQAKQALENTVNELFFNYGSQQAEQAVQQSAVTVSTAASANQEHNKPQQ